MIDEKTEFLSKARESLQGAASELEQRRYNNAANRAYYACFHAAIAALIDAGIRPERDWGHEFVAARFSGWLVYRIKAYPSNLRTIVQENGKVRQLADYAPMGISEKDAKRAVERARALVQAVAARLEGKE